MFPNPIDQAYALIEGQNYAAALELFTDLHRQDPANPRVNYGLGVAYLALDAADRAIPHLTAAAKSAKKEAVIFTTLANALNIEGRNEEALPHARKGASLAPKLEYTNRVLGETYSDLRRPVMARQSLERAVKSDPKSARAHLGLYELETTLGNSDAAEKHLEAAFEYAPEDPTVLISAANSGNTEMRNKVLLNIERVLSARGSNAANSEDAKLAFAAGRICDRTGDLEKAFSFYESRRDGLYRGFDPETAADFVRTCGSFFTRDFFQERKDFALSSEKPVFVVGMPRSGTTLVEQIIARHPHATGAGEVPFFPDRVREITENGKQTPAFFQRVRNLDKRDAQRIGRKYLTLLDGLDKKARRAVDKMPHNFEHLWLLALLFPNATFVHVTRAPADTCLSIYLTPLAAYHSYNVDQTSLGSYYAQYQQLMRHWSEVLPVDLRHQSYETLVKDQEQESRKLIEHAGLTWHDGCLKPPGDDSQVFTFSREQVRKPVYATSIGRWKRYEPFIGKLLASLGEPID